MKKKIKKINLTAGMQISLMKRGGGHQFVWTDRQATHFTQLMLCAGHNCMMICNYMLCLLNIWTATRGQQQYCSLINKVQMLIAPK